MTSYRSTSLRLTGHCLHALELHELGAVPDAWYYTRGAAAHAVLQAIGEETNRLDRVLTEDEVTRVADAVVVRLTTEGRTFDAEPEPPLPPIETREGAELALGWLADDPLYPGASYEVGLAVGTDWRPAPYDRRAHYRGILDVLRQDEIDLQLYTVIRDYKSYWSAGERELRSLQIRGYAVLAWRHGLLEGRDALRLEIANLQARKTYHRDLYLSGGGDGEPSGIVTLRRWAQQIRDQLAGIERSRDEAGGLPASPGRGCSGCPYLAHCAYARGYYEAAGIPDDPSEAATLWVVTAARLEQIRAALEPLADGGSIQATDGSRVGWVPKEETEPAQLADMMIAERFEEHPGGDNAGNVSGFAMAAKLGVGNLRAVARAMAPRDREGQAKILDGLLQTKIGRKWGAEGGDDEPK